VNGQGSSKGGKGYPGPTRGYPLGNPLSISPFYFFRQEWF